MGQGSGNEVLADALVINQFLVQKPQLRICRREVIHGQTAFRLSARCEPEVANHCASAGVMMRRSRKNVGDDRTRTLGLGRDWAIMRLISNRVAGSRLASSGSIRYRPQNAPELNGPSSITTSSFSMSGLTGVKVYSWFSFQRKKFVVFLRERKLTNARLRQRSSSRRSFSEVANESRLCIPHDRVTRPSRRR